MITTIQRVRVIAWALIGLPLLSGCGDSRETTPIAEESREPAGRPASVSEPAAQAANLPLPDASKPLADYFSLQGAHQLAALYYALSGMPPDVEALARVNSREYARTSDAFRKQDLLKALTPQLTQQVEQARNQRYFWVDHQSVCLGHYDMNGKTFPVSGGPTADSYLFFDNERSFRLAFANGDQFRELRVPDEARARELEGLVTRGAACGNLRLYLFAQSVDLRSQSVSSQIVKAQLHDYQRRLVTEF